MRPILCNYYVTYRCNAKCNFCDIWHNSKYRHSSDANLKDVTRNLYDLKKIGIKFIDFTGGEPLLNKSLPDMLKIAKKLKFLTSVTTNCILYPSRANEIHGLIDFLHFSLDSLDREVNKQIRGVDTYDDVMKSIEIAKKLGEKPDILYTVTNDNMDAIHKLYQFCKNQKIMLLVNPVFFYSDQKPLSYKKLKSLNKFKTKSYVYINMALHNLIMNGGNSIQKPRCKAVSSTIVISPENKLLLPCFHHSIKEIDISNSIEEILKSDEYMEFKEHEGRFDFCESCSINCYLDPSFTHKFDKLFILSFLSKAKYVIDKNIKSRF